MTAVNILVKQDAVYLMTDGAFFNAEDRVCATGVKQTVYPDVPAAITMRGHASVLAQIEAALGDARSLPFDVFLSRVRSVIQTLSRLNWQKWINQKGGDASASEFDFFVVGWSHEFGPQAFCIRHGVNDLAPIMQEIHFRSQCFAPYAASGVQMIESISDPYEALLAMVVEQRSEISVVGGPIHITRITKDGADCRDAAHWPDKIGQIIDGSAQLRLGAPAAAMASLSASPVNMVLRGDFIADGAITARTVAARSITAENGAIDSLAVKSLNLGDNAVTVTKVQSLANPLFGGSGAVVANSFVVNVDTTGLAGKQVTTLATWTASIGYTGGNAGAQTVILYINGVAVMSGSAGAQVGAMTLSGAVDLTATGGIMSISCEVHASFSSNEAVLQARTLSALVVKR